MIHFNKTEAGIAFCDVSTGEFLVAQGSLPYIEKLLQNFKPNELLFEKSKRDQLNNLVSEKLYSFGLDDWAFHYDHGYESLLKQFETNSLKGFGIEELTNAISACGALLHYLNETKHDKLKHITKVSRINEEQFVWLDRFTIRNLELYGTNHENGKSLIDVIDKTISPMGSRLLKRWLALPLKHVDSINDRLNAVEFFVKNESLRTELVDALSEIGDLERLISKVAVQRVNPREMVQLKRSLLTVKNIQAVLNQSESEALKKIAEQLNPCDSIIEKINYSLNEDAPVNILKGNAILSGVNSELDELRNIAFSGKDYLLKIQQQEIEKTGITSLKISYNNVFGYYLEVTNVHKDKVPTDWIRKQTLTNAERYITPELKVYEEKILGAEEKITALEQQLFESLVLSVNEFISPIQLNASLIAKTDVLLGYALVAIDNNYCKPELSSGFEIQITEGRHPVIEKQLPLGTEYVSNSIFFG